MSYEDDVRDILAADAAMQALMTGGFYTEQQVGVEGIRRGDDVPTELAFDERGELKGTVLVREGNALPYGTVRSQRDKITAMSKLVSIYFFEMRGHEVVDAAKNRAYALLEGIRLPTKSYPIWLVAETPPVPDTGPIANSTTIRQDWMVVFIRKPT